MGLLEKANAFARPKSLLHRSLELLREEDATGESIPPAAPAEAALPGGSAPPAASLPAEAAAPPAFADDGSPVFDIPVFQVRVEREAGPPAPEEAAGEAGEAPATGDQRPPDTTADRPGVGRPPAIDAAAIAAGLVEAAAALPPTIDLPSRLFGLLKDRLGIERGALLLLDAPRGVFAPWAACGFDAATLRRLRIPPAEPALAALAAGEPVEVTDAKRITELRRFFSSRDSLAVERLSIAPLAADGGLGGMLVVSAMAATGGEALATLGRAAAAAGGALRTLRQSILRPPRTVPASPREAREDLARFLAAHPRGAKPFTVFPLSLERCRRRVAAANPWLDPFRLEEDLRTVVGAFTADIGRAVHLGRLRFLVALHDLGTGDTDLFAHQLSALLGSLFHAVAFEPDDAEVGDARAFPAGAEATPEAAAELLATLAAS